MTLQDQIDCLQRYIIVHSYLYYSCDSSIISDKEFDTKARELVKYKNDYPDLWKKSEYFKQFGDEYTGATGFTLYSDLNLKQREIIRAIAGILTRRSP